MQVTDLLFLSLFAIVPAGLLAFVRPLARRVLLLVGLIVGVGLEWVVNLGGPDSPALIIPLTAFGLSAGALLVELAVLCARSIKRIVGAQSRS